MFTNFTLTTELVRQRQSDMLARSERRRWFHRSPVDAAATAPAMATAASSCPVVELPAPRTHAARGDALVA
ncbi:MAG: hypothetical protein ABMA25_04060 [Ilumatobacteraceae bacterium]